jgi:ribosomal protein S27E
MAQALECPACGNRHRLDGLEPSTKFRCARCGQTLLVPEGVGARSTAAVDAATKTDVVTAPPRRGGTSSGVAPAAGGVTITLPASGEPTAVSVAGAPVDESGKRHRRRVHWYWRLLAWIVAIPLGFVVAVWPSYEFGLISKDDVLDVFVGSGTERYTHLALVTLIWALVTAVLVQVLVEGGRWLADRRRRRRERASAATMHLVSS